jgi:tryptophan-rich sensory protein
VHFVLFTTIYAAFIFALAVWHLAAVAAAQTLTIDKLAALLPVKYPFLLWAYFPGFLYGFPCPLPLAATLSLVHPLRLAE